MNFAQDTKAAELYEVVKTVEGIHRDKSHYRLDVVKILVGPNVGRFDLRTYKRHDVYYLPPNGAVSGTSVSNDVRLVAWEVIFIPSLHGGTEYPAEEGAALNLGLKELFG